MKHLIALIALLGITASLAASEHQGQVKSGEIAVPGAVVRATQGDKVQRAITDTQGNYAFADLPDGTWTVRVEMFGFTPITQEMTIAPGMAATTWNLKMLPLSAMKTETPQGFAPATPALRLTSRSAAETVSGTTTASVNPKAAQGLLINGSVNNGASTPFAQAAAIGNNRNRPRSPYNGSISFNGSNSAFDARPFSVTGQNTPKPAYERLQGGLILGGPLRIPHVIHRGQFTVSYNRTQNRNPSLQTSQLPTAAERGGDFSSSPTPIVDPATGLPFSGNVIPTNRISPQANALLSFYPLPNSSNGGRFNYQVPIVGVTHGDNFQGAINNIAINSSNRISGAVSYSSTRSDNPNLFHFLDTTTGTATNGSLTWNHNYTRRLSAVIRYSFSRSVTQSTPFFSNRQNVAGNAGILGGDPDPRNWGPPNLNFSSGIARLSDGQYAFNRSQSSTISYTTSFVHGRHAFGLGADYRKQQFNLLSQQDARGTMTFTGATTGVDFADFLLGVPAASSIAFGNPDKYFRQSVTNAYVMDDWRIKSNFTMNVGVRWEYESPITEKYGRLVNLNIAPDFSNATPVIASSKSNSLVHPDKLGAIEPRLGFAWRPSVEMSTVVKGGYGIYRDTNVYRAIADQMAQQSPLSKSLSVQNTPSNPLTLADAFKGSPSITATTFAIDPNFKVGNAQNWTLSIQQDLPASMQMTVMYLGIKGTHVPQRTLPNTFPAGAINTCTTCPSGFVYLMSNGNTTRNAGAIEVRRRQRNGFQASVSYTFAKAIDDAGLGGASIAQNWLDLRGERSLSNFDQRHVLQIQTQYTSGMLAHLGSFWDSWRGTLLKQWTITSQLNMGSGMPLTPVILAPVKGTGVTGSLRPDRTGASLYTNSPSSSSSSSGYLNPLAFATPAAGQWGNAGRNSITGPAQFSLDASLARTFRVTKRVTMDLTVNATNVLNHVTFPNWNTTVNSSQFGLPNQANGMRSVRPLLRVRF